MTQLLSFQEGDWEQFLAPVIAISVQVFKEKAIHL
jgi:hypothetical protein